MTTDGEPIIYHIIRYYYGAERRRTIRNNVTLTEVQAHCSREDTYKRGFGLTVKITCAVAPQGRTDIHPEMDFFIDDGSELKIRKENTEVYPVESFVPAFEHEKLFITVGGKTILKLRFYTHGGDFVIEGFEDNI